jgi:hypothetical protein
MKVFHQAITQFFAETYINKCVPSTLNVDIEKIAFYCPTFENPRFPG